MTMMGTEDGEPMHKGFEDRTTEHEVDDEVFSGQIEDPEDKEKPETEAAKVKTE